MDPQNIGTLGTFFRWVISLLQIPMHMWGFTFTMLDVVYGTTIWLIIVGFLNGVVVNVKRQYGRE